MQRHEEGPVVSASKLKHRHDPGVADRVDCGVLCLCSPVLAVTSSDGPIAVSLQWIFEDFHRPSRAALAWLYAVSSRHRRLYLREAFFYRIDRPFNSMHGEWLAMARIAGLDWYAPRWWPYWGGGAPIEYAYAPLIPFSIAALAAFALFAGAGAEHRHGLGLLPGPLALYVAMLADDEGAGTASGLRCSNCLRRAPDTSMRGRGFGLAWWNRAAGFPPVRVGRPASPRLPHAFPVAFGCWRAR